MTIDTTSLPVNARILCVLDIVPMIGPVDLEKIPYGTIVYNILEDYPGHPGIDIVRVGGGDEPLHPDWVRSVRDQCEPTGVAFVFVGWGDWVPVYGAGRVAYPEEIVTVGDADMRCVGTEAAGRILDGRTHDWPEATP